MKSEVKKKKSPPFYISSLYVNYMSYGSKMQKISLEELPPFLNSPGKKVLDKSCMRCFFKGHIHLL